AGRGIRSVRDLTFAVAEQRPGETVSVDVVRGGETERLQVELGNRTAATASASPQPRARPGARADNAALGLRLAPVTDRERSTFSLPRDVGGALVAEVRPDSPAARAGLRTGDLIVSVNRRNVTSVQDATAALQSAQREGRRA